jgi:hypothetical protein
MRAVRQDGEANAALIPLLARALRKSTFCSTWPRLKEKAGGWRGLAEGSMDLVVAVALSLTAFVSAVLAAPVTKGQACEKLALKETYPVAMRDKCQDRLTVECKRLIDGWLKAAQLEKRRCIDRPRGDLQ